MKRTPSLIEGDISFVLVWLVKTLTSFYENHSEKEMSPSMREGFTSTSFSTYMPLKENLDESLKRAKKLNKELKGLCKKFFLPLRNRSILGKFSPHYE